jgi:hypothetical protein
VVARVLVITTTLFLPTRRIPRAGAGGCRTDRPTPRSAALIVGVAEQLGEAVDAQAPLHRGLVHAVGAGADGQPGELDAGVAQGDEVGGALLHRRRRQQRARPPPTSRPPATPSDCLTMRAAIRVRHGPEAIHSAVCAGGRARGSNDRAPSLPDGRAALLAATPARAYVRAVTPSGAPWHWDPPGADPRGPRRPAGPGADLGRAGRGGVRGGGALGPGAARLHLGGHHRRGRLRCDGAGEADGVNRVVFRRREWCPDPREPGEPCYVPEISPSPRSGPAAHGPDPRDGHRGQRRQPPLDRLVAHPGAVATRPVRRDSSTEKYPLSPLPLSHLRPLTRRHVVMSVFRPQPCAADYDELPRKRRPAVKTPSLRRSSPLCNLAKVSSVRNRRRRGCPRTPLSTMVGHRKILGMEHPSLIVCQSGRCTAGIRPVRVGCCTPHVVLPPAYLRAADRVRPRAVGVSTQVCWRVPVDL